MPRSVVATRMRAEPALTNAWSGSGGPQYRSRPYSDPWVVTAQLIVVLLSLAAASRGCATDMAIDGAPTLRLLRSN